MGATTIRTTRTATLIACGAWLLLLGLGCGFGGDDEDEESTVVAEVAPSTERQVADWAFDVGGQLLRGLQDGTLESNPETRALATTLSPSFQAVRVRTFYRHMGPEPGFVVYLTVGSDRRIHYAYMDTHTHPGAAAGRTTPALQAFHTELRATITDRGCQLPLMTAAVYQAEGNTEGLDTAPASAQRTVIGRCAEWQNMLANRRVPTRRYIINAYLNGTPQRQVTGVLEFEPNGRPVLSRAGIADR